MKIQRIEFTPAFDKRNSDPSKNYGIHGVEMRWLYGDKKGVVQFLIYTNWQLPHVEFEMEKNRTPFYVFRPMAANLGCHSPVPQYEGQESLTKSCSYLDGRPCYYDGSIRNAEEVFDLLLKEGGDAVWKRLHEEYDAYFGETK